MHDVVVFGGADWDQRTSGALIGPARNALPALWVELYDAAGGQMLDSVGCEDIEAAVVVGTPSWPKPKASLQNSRRFRCGGGSLTVTTTSLHRLGMANPAPMLTDLPLCHRQMHPPLISAKLTLISADNLIFRKNGGTLRSYRSSSREQRGPAKGGHGHAPAHEVSCRWRAHRHVGRC
jgi:hypothetical protein